LTAKQRLSRPLSLLWGTVAGTALVVGLGAAPRWASGLAALPACPLRGASGWPCPACGSGRALVALSAGQFAAAFAWNPLVVLFALVFVAGGLAAAIAALTGRRLAEPRDLPFVARLTLVAVLGLDWIYLAWAGR